MYALHMTMILRFFLIIRFMWVLDYNDDISPSIYNTNLDFNKNTGESLGMHFFMFRII